MKVVMTAWLLVGGCTPANVIGETAWVIDTDLKDSGAIGPAGHLARSSGVFLELRHAGGEFAWARVCEGYCGGQFAVDGDGNVYSVRNANSLALVKRSAVDGEIVWSHEFPSTNHASVVLDADGAVWLVFNDAEPVDLGGGPVGDEQAPGRWGRFAPDGNHLASGALDSMVDPFVRPAAPPGGGIVVPLRDSGLVAIDDAGEERWRVDRLVTQFAVHEDGELTLLEWVGSNDLDGESGVELVRLDADRRERWRRRSGLADRMTPLANGGVLLRGWDGLASNGGGGFDVTYLEYFDASGSSMREVFVPYVVLFGGPAFDGYRFFVKGDGDIDLHDRTATSRADGVLVSRNLP